MKSITVTRLVQSLSLMALSLSASADPIGTFSNPWSGIYLGFNLGGTFNSATLYAHQLGFDNMPGICDSTANFSSAYPGVEVGFTQQFPSRWVVGVLGDYSYNFNRNTNFACVCQFNTSIWDRFNVQNKMQGSLLGRMGYALNNRFLVSFAGGVSFANLGMNYNNEIGDYYAISNVQAGWRVGGGFDWGIASNWSIGLLYYYTSYNAFNLGMPIVYGLIDPNGNANLQMNTNIIQGSIKYWFN